MSDIKQLLILFGVPLTVSGSVAWLFWGPIRGFCFSCVPSGAEYAWVGKLLCLFLITWLGGIGLPIFIFLVVLMVTAAAIK